MNIFKSLIAVLVAFGAAFAAVGMSLPRDFAITRSIVISAHPIKVHLHVGELSVWPEWWPWNSHGPKASFTPGTATSGVGASLSWNGRPAPGRITFTKTVPTEGVEYDVLLDGHSAPYRGAFVYRGTANETQLEWKMSGRFQTPILGGYLALMADAMHGGMFEVGLRNIKRQVEEDRREMLS